MKLTIAILALFCVGCANPWESGFQKNPSLEGQQVAPAESVQIRSVEFARLQRYAASERQVRINSTTAPEDLPPEQRLAAKNRLLEALQLRERNDEAEILGWSEFATEERLDPHDGKLAKFARSLGADYAVVASEYAGKVQQTVERPMTAYWNNYGTTVHGRRGPRAFNESSTSTVWVPMNVIADQYVYQVAFVHKTHKQSGP